MNARDKDRLDRFERHLQAVRIVFLIVCCYLVVLRFTPPDPANESYVDTGIRVDWNRAARSAK